MTVLSEGRHPGEIIIGGHDDISKDVLVIPESQTVKPGAVLGKVAIVAGVVATPSYAGTGNGVLTLASPPVSTKVKDGDYKLTCVTAAANGGVFRVEDPQGRSLGNATVGQAFNKDLKFTIADGATDFVVGDEFTITVAADAEDFVYPVLNPAGTDGSEVAAAIALYGATTGVGVTAKITGITYHQEVNGAVLEWPAGISATQKADAIQALAANRIKVR